MKYFLAFFMVFMVTTDTLAQLWEKGVVIDSVVANKANDESFAIYLPQSYNPAELNSIVFVFDPSGRGKNGLKNFLSVAERFGHILVCSNNAKNGPYQQNFDIANRLFNKVFEEFNIDPEQIYLAGFSGGSRIATAIAVLTKQMRGIIGRGAIFPETLAFAPTTPDFLYVGLVGDRDMNLLEMRNNYHFLQKLDFTNEVIIFEDGHIWPPPDVLHKAFEWIELTNHKDGISEINEERLHEIYSTAIEEVNNTTDILLRKHRLEGLISNFRGIMEIDSL